MVSNIPLFEQVFGTNTLQMIGEPILAGAFLLLVIVCFFAFSGMGMEAVIVIGIPVLIGLVGLSFGLLPTWIILLVALVFAVAIMIVFGAFRNR